MAPTGALSNYVQWKCLSSWQTHIITGGKIFWLLVLFLWCLTFCSFVFALVRSNHLSSCSGQVVRNDDVWHRVHINSSMSWHVSVLCMQLVSLPASCAGLTRLFCIDEAKHRKHLSIRLYDSSHHLSHEEPHSSSSDSLCFSGSSPVLHTAPFMKKIKYKVCWSECWVSPHPDKYHHTNWFCRLVKKKKPERASRDSWQARTLKHCEAAQLIWKSKSKISQIGLMLVFTVKQGASF